MHRFILLLALMTGILTGPRIGVVFAAPVIERLGRDGTLVWSNDSPGSVSVLEQMTNSVNGWERIYFDTGETGRVHSIKIPNWRGRDAFYRFQVVDSPLEAGLLLHIPFESDLTSGLALDASGNGNHGYRFGYECCQTNWPTSVVGVDGGTAALFRWYNDGKLLFGKTGDYIAVTNVGAMAAMPTATIMTWARYFRANGGDWLNDKNAALINGGYSDLGSWTLGRIYSAATLFGVEGSPSRPLQFPDSTLTTGGDTLGWHHYAVTFDRGKAKAFFDGVLVDEVQTIIPTLILGHYLWNDPWIAIGCETHNGTPWIDDESADGSVANDYPNNGWLNGMMDDVRIYDRPLSASEIEKIFLSFDHEPPTPPLGITVRAASSTMAEVRWGAANDNFGVRGYRVVRDGTEVADLTGNLYVDTNLPPGTTHRYSIVAYDRRGLVSEQSAAIDVVMPAAGSGVEVILDDADGAPWVVQTGGVWLTYSSLPGYYGTGFLSDDKVGKGKSLVYRPIIPEPGKYDIFMRYPGRDDISYVFADSIPVEIVHQFGTNIVTVGERSGYGQWKLLGRFELGAGTNATIRVRTAGTTGFVMVDAFRFVK